MTTLFCDVAGFTQRAATLDPEDVRSLLAPYYARLRSELESFGATVEKFIGDAVFALFGAPRAHEDDPERAVRAAFAIRQAVAHLNETDPKLDLHIRIGINTGEAVVALGARPSEGEAMAWGDTVNTCSRLQAAAPLDAILVGETTYRATHRQIDYRRVEPVRAKGKADPIPAWVALAPRATGLEPAQGQQAALVGRADELAVLISGLETCRRQETVRLITLLGPPGIGKSRLVRELYHVVAASPEPTSWRQGRSLPYGGGVTYWALGEMVKVQAGILESDPAQRAAQKLDDAVRDLFADEAQASRVTQGLRPLIGLAAAEDLSRFRDSSFASWRQFFHAMAEQQPLVLVFEDLHWADGDLLEFIEALLEGARGVSLLVICTARPELLDRRPSFGRGADADLLVVPELSEVKTADLLRALIGGDGLTESLQQRIVAGAAGNPLYTVEYVRMLVDRGPLGEGVEEPHELAAPESVRSIIASRLDALPWEHKALVQSAAVVGAQFWVGALAAVHGARRADVVEGLRSLERKEFVRRMPTTAVEGEGQYAFCHALVQEVAYGQIPRRRRGKTHQLAAEWIESLGPDRALDRAELVGHHYLEALELARATGGETNALAVQARLALRDAGDKARALHAYASAMRLYGSALELWPPDDPERPSLCFRAGEARFHAETSGDELLTEARDALLADEAGLAAEAEALLAHLAHHRGERGRVLEHAGSALARVTPLEPGAAKASVLADVAGLLVAVGEPREVLSPAWQALEIARLLQLREHEANALGIIGTARWQLGDLGGEDDLERSAAIALEIDSPLGAFAYGNLADTAACRGDLARCFELQAHARRQADRFGDPGVIRWLTAERAHEDYWRGHWNEALELVEGLILRSAGGSRHFSDESCMEVRARIRLGRGDVAGAVDDASAALEHARGTNVQVDLFPALALLACCRVASGATDGASQLADELILRWRDRRHKTPPSFWIADLAEVMETLGRSDELLREAARAPNRTLWLDAGSAVAGDDFVHAAEVYARIGSAPDEARSRLRAGRHLRREGLAPDAAAQETRALALLQRMGVHHADRATGLAAPSGPR